MPIICAVTAGYWVAYTRGYRFGFMDHGSSYLGTVSLPQSPYTKKTPPAHYFMNRLLPLAKLVNFRVAAAE